MSTHRQRGDGGQARVKELLGFFWASRVWWLTPMIAVLLLLGVLMVFAQSQAALPFLYTIF